MRREGWKEYESHFCSGFDAGSSVTTPKESRTARAPEREKTMTSWKKRPREREPKKRVQLMCFQYHFVQGEHILTVLRDGCLEAIRNPFI